MLPPPSVGGTELASGEVSHPKAAVDGECDAVGGEDASDPGIGICSEHVILRLAMVHGLKRVAANATQRL